MEKEKKIHRVKIKTVQATTEKCIEVLPAMRGK